MTHVAREKQWNVLNSRERGDNINPDLPTLLFLGPQDQMTTTGLFLSSEVPNLVTGDLSLSDALYGLIAMDGPSFFYETPDWKVPTFARLYDMINRKNPSVGVTHLIGSNYIGSKWWDKSDLTNKTWTTAMTNATLAFMDEGANKFYTETMRDAVREEIQRRFGNVQVVGDLRQGHYIAPGAPYLLQDATAKVVETLRENPEVLAETEKARKLLRDGTPVVVNVQTGVLEQKPFEYPSSEEIFPKPLYDNDYIYKYLQKEKGNPYFPSYSLDALLSGKKYKKGSSYLDDLLGIKGYSSKSKKSDKIFPAYYGGLYNNENCYKILQIIENN